MTHSLKSLSVSVTLGCKFVLTHYIICYDVCFCILPLAYVLLVVNDPEPEARMLRVKPCLSYYQLRVLGKLPETL